MKKLTKILSLLLAAAMVLSLAACGSAAAPAASDASQSSQTSDASQASEAAAPKDEKPLTLHVAYQYGLAYAPLILVQQNELIEKAYSEATGKTVEVFWDQMSSGADINVGIASGNLDVGFMGVAPAITGISKKVGYKIFTNLSGQEHGMMTNDPELQSLADLVGSDKQIALVNIGSIQHIILGLTLKANGYDAHALDANLVGMKHPDGKAALESGSIPCHLTSNPYIYKERANEALHEIVEVKNAWAPDNSFIVGVASEALNAEHPELYAALCQALAEAIDMVNADFEATAKITCEYNGNTFEDELFYLKAGSYGAETKGLLDLARFMYENNFVEVSFESYRDLVFDNVKGT